MRRDHFEKYTRNYQHDVQDWTGHATEAETMPKIIHPYQQQISVK